jgi:uncharacterized protein (TIGR03435 family)
MRRSCTGISVVIAALSFVGTSFAVAAQDKAASPPTFEVSTVKPGNPAERSSNLNFGKDAIRSTNLPLLFLLQYAYKLNSGSTDQIVGAPPWMSSLRFDINAKMSEETATRIGKMSYDDADATLRLMLQGLLADRFQLRVHHETRELPVMALMIAKNGSKLTVATMQPATDSSKPHGPDDWTGLHNPRDGLMEGRDAPIAMMVNALSWKPEIGGRLVVDQTGLKGNYNFTLSWTSDSGGVRADNPNESEPSLFTALQEQLGLKLESKKAPVDCIVIDTVEQPAPN